MINGETRKGVLEAVKDPLYRLTRTDRTNPGATPPNQWTWNYDAVGNRTSAQKDSEATTSSYNEKNQLTGATGGGKMLWRGTLDEPGIATFSASTINGQPARMLAGNVFEATLDLPAGANNVTIQAQDGSGNVATKVYSVNVIGVPASYTYDANGNLAARTEGADSWTYTWNALNQLTGASKNAVTQAAYSYDPVGRRVEKIAVGVTSVWVYDGQAILRQTAGVAASMFVHGPTIDEPLAEITATATEYLHADALGSITSHTTGSGSIAKAISYDPWGKLQGSTPTPFGFTGREWDPVAQLHYYRARWYDSKLGRFVSEDPVHWPDKPNLYPYVGDDPVNFVDPSGETPFKNNSGRPIPYKPESQDGVILLCLPGQTCDVDGVYPPACDKYPIKVVDGCIAEATPDGKLQIVCPIYDGNAPLKRRFPRLGQMVTGGPTNKDFHDQHKDWPPPNSQPNCGCK